MKKKSVVWLFATFIFLSLLIFLTTCNMMDYKSTVYGYVLSDPTYRDPVSGVSVTLRVTSADDVPDYFAVTDENGYYIIEFEMGFRDEDGHYIPNSVVSVNLNFSYGDLSYSLSDIRITAGSYIPIPTVYLSQFSGGTGGGGGK